MSGSVIQIHAHAPAPSEVQLRKGGVELVDVFTDRWLGLCRESGIDAPFYHPAWIGAYLRAFESRARVLLVTAHSGERLTAVLPLIQERATLCGIPVRKLRGAANAHCNRFDLVRAAGGEGDAAVRLIWETLCKRSDWDVIELPYVVSGGAAEQLLDLAAADGHFTGKYELGCSPYIPLGGVDDVARIPRNSHFRQNLRRRMRKAQSQYGVRLIRIDSADPKALWQYYELESRGWKGKDKAAIASTEWIRGFYDEIARIGARDGYFVLYLLEFGDRTVAGHFGLVYNGRYYCPRVSYDETYAAFGPGHLIVEAILRDLVQRGVCEFDFLGGWMEWKGEWTQLSRPYNCCYIFRPGLFGRTLCWMKLDLMTKARESWRQLRFHIRRRFR